MKIVLKNLVLLSLLSFVLIGCSENHKEHVVGKPAAFGRINDIAVIADETMMDSPVGDTLHYYFTSSYPILPQPEPLFDLRHIQISEINANPARKQLRTYIVLANTSDKESLSTQLLTKAVGEENVRATLKETGFATKMAKERWATGQLLFFMYADSDEKLMDNISQNFPAITKKIRDHEQEQLESTVYFGNEETLLEQEIYDSLGVKMRLPRNYKKALYAPETNTYWIRRLTDDVDFNIFIRKMPYTDQSQLTKEGLIAVRDSLGKYVSTPEPNTYMKINNIDLPMYVEARTISNRFALEAKGIWEIENDFMGGPFVSYLIHNADSNELLFVDGFIYAPRKKKREYIQQLEYIINQIKF